MQLPEAAQLLNVCPHICCAAVWASVAHLACITGTVQPAGMSRSLPLHLRNPAAMLSKSLHKSCACLGCCMVCLCPGCCVVCLHLGCCVVCLCPGCCVVCLCPGCCVVCLCPGCCVVCLCPGCCVVCLHLGCCVVCLCPGCCVVCLCPGCHPASASNLAPFGTRAAHAYAHHALAYMHAHTHTHTFVRAHTNTSAACTGPPPKSGDTTRAGAARRGSAGSAGNGAAVEPRTGARQWVPSSLGLRRAQSCASTCL